MTAMRPWKLRRWALALAAVSSFAWTEPAAFGQEPEKKDFPSMEEILHGSTSKQAKENAEARMRRLFGEVESKLQRVDLLLTDAAAGNTQALQNAKTSGISDLLRDSIDRGRAAQKDIQEILEIARELASQTPSQAGGQSAKSGKSGQSPGAGQKGGQGSPRQGSDKNQSTESTPELPAAKRSGEDGKQPGGEQKPGGQKQPKDPQAGGREPRSPGGDPKDQGQNRNGSKREGDAGGQGSKGQGEDGWGNLPSQVRDTFRSEGRSELPARYRDWIDEYYRKLNKRGPKR